MKNIFSKVLITSLFCVLPTCLQSKAGYVASGDNGIQGGDPVSSSEGNDYWFGFASSSADGSISYSGGQVSFSGNVNCATGGWTDPMYQNGLNGGTGGSTSNTIYVDSCGFYWEGDASQIFSVTVNTRLSLAGTLEAGAWIYGDSLYEVFYWAGIGAGSVSFYTGGDVTSGVSGAISGGSTNGVSTPISETGVPVTYQEGYTGEYGWYRKINFSINDSLEYSIEGCPGSIIISPQMSAESSCFITVITDDNVDWEGIQANAVGNASISGSVAISVAY